MMQTGKNTNVIPEAKAGLDKFKYEIAGEIGMSNYATVDKGMLTSKENGSVGGYMVKKMVEAYENGLTGK